MSEQLTPEQIAAEAESIGKPKGRPRKAVDENIIYELARLMCSNVEIAGVLQISLNTLTDRYSHVLEEGRSEAKISLRREQFRKAMEGNVQMLIWLGRQYLNQVETVINKDENEILPWSDEKFTERKQEIIEAAAEDFDIVTVDSIAKQDK
jgi:hypothetical protein